MVDLAQIALRARARKSEGHKDTVNILDFIEAEWGLGGTISLYPIQRIVLKAHYGIPLDDNPYNLDLSAPVPVDHPEYEQIAGPVELEDGHPLLDRDGNPVRFYRHRIEVSDWQRKKYEWLSEADYLKKLHAEGRANISEVVEGDERRTLILSLGRRSGKSFLASCIKAYEVYKLIMKESPQVYYGVPPGDDIQLITIATNKEQAKLLYQKVSGHFFNSTFFTPYRANHTQSYARFQTPADQERYGRFDDDEKAKASINITFSPSKAAALRGAANIVIVFDEFAHALEHGSDSAKAMWDAAQPSRSTFSPKDKNKRAIGPVEARMLAISTPMGKSGEFYRLFQQGMKGGRGSQDYLCIQAPTWEVNPTIPASEFEAAYAKDPVVFMTEYGAEFSDRTRGWITDERDILECINPDAKPQDRGFPRTPYYLGFDLGLVGDSSAVAIGHIEYRGRDPKIVVDLVDSIQAGEGKYVDYDRLEFDDIADWIRDLCRKFLIREGIFDQYNGIVLQQALVKRGLGQMQYKQFTQNLTSEIYENFRHTMWDRRIEFYNHPVAEGEVYCDYLQELLELQETRVSKHIKRVEAPNQEGKHDDRSDALSRMVWLASQQLTNPNYISPPGGRRGGQNPRNVYRGVAVGARGMVIGGGTHPDRQFFKGRRGGRERR